MRLKSRVPAVSTQTSRLGDTLPVFLVGNVMFGGRPVCIPTPGFKCAQQWAPGAALEWMFINDNVMGGQSTSKLDADPSDGAIILSGVMDDLRGGFLQLRTAQSCRVVIPDGATSVKVTAQGDGQLYKMYLSGSGRGGPMWGHDFVASESMQEHVLPLSGFNPSVMGQAVNGPSLDPTQVGALGITLSLKTADGRPNPHFHGGPFRLKVYDISFQ